MVLLIYSSLVIVIITVIMSLSHFLGQKHKSSSTDIVFESGVEPTGNARLRFPAQFYILAMFFVIFDLEAVFIIAWAVAFKEVGWAGYWGILIFISMLLIVLVYEWRIKALDFGPKGKLILSAYKQLKKSKEV